jgi:hypothetical protein
MYLKMKTRALPTERLDLLQKWINDALSLQEQMSQPPEAAIPPEEMMALEAEQLPPEITQGV